MKPLLTVSGLEEGGLFVFLHAHIIQGPSPLKCATWRLCFSWRNYISYNKPKDTIHSFFSLLL